MLSSCPRSLPRQEPDKIPDLKQKSVWCSPSPPFAGNLPPSAAYPSSPLFTAIASPPPFAANTGLPLLANASPPSESMASLRTLGSALLEMAPPLEFAAPILTPESPFLRLCWSRPALCLLSSPCWPAPLLASALQCLFLGSAHQCQLLDSAHQCQLLHSARSGSGAHRVHSRACSVLGVHRFHSRAHSIPGTHRVCASRAPPSFQSTPPGQRSPQENFGGGLSVMAHRVPGSTMADRVPRSTMAAQVPGSAMAGRAPSSIMAARAPCSTVSPGTGTALEAICPVSMSLEASRAPKPTPHWMLYGADAPVGRGVTSDLYPHVLCLPSSCAHILSFLSSFCHHWFISPRLCLITPHLFEFSSFDSTVFLSLSFTYIFFFFL